jgi:uncharacterized protein with HEPN domain
VNPDDRIEGLLEDLEQTLQYADELVSRGRSEFDKDIAMRLAFEALSNREGEVSKQLVELDPRLFSESDWSFASKNRDKVVHHYNAIDHELLWATVSIYFPTLRALAQSKRAG